MTYEWFRDHLLSEIAPRWLESSRTDNGLFCPHLDRQWHVKSAEPVTLVSQTRLIYNFATAWKLTGDAAYQEAVSEGADALLRFFGSDTAGAWRWSVHLDGRAADEHRNAYGHAFVIFGLSHATAATRDARYREAALATVCYVFDAFRDAVGGLKPALDADGREIDPGRTQNPIMHLFEALLALGYEVGEEEGRSRAAEVGNWVMTRLIRSDGLLPEMYARDWQALPEDGGGRIDIGHQFEWAYLLSRSAELGLWPGSQAEGAVKGGSRLLDGGMKIGFDAENGGIWSPASSSGRLLSRAKGWWEQCEAARAMMHYAVLRGRSDLSEPFQATMRFCLDHLIDPDYGGWYMRVEPDGTVRSMDKGNVWKVDYHVVGLCAEALRLLHPSSDTADR